MTSWWPLRATLIGSVLVLIPILIYAWYPVAEPTTWHTVSPEKDLLLTGANTLVFIVLYGYLVSPAIVSAWRVTGKKFLRALGCSTRIPITRVIALGILGALSMALGEAVYALLFRWMHLSVPSNTQDILPGLHAMPITTLVFILLGAIGAPFFEELFFRSFLFVGLGVYIPVWLAAAISSLCFALVHGNLELIPPLFLSGCVLCYLRYTSKSMWPGYAAHAISNSLVFGLLIWQALIK